MRNPLTLKPQPQQAKNFGANHKNFQLFFSRYQSRVKWLLEQILNFPNHELNPLHHAMRYALLTGGKRIRPLLIYAVGETFTAELAALDACACAVEIIHGYSLIHDDLPPMDNDDLRRSLPSCHRAFDEATAIIAGDALQALAFEVLANASSITAEKRLKIIALLAQACGSLGMVGGQALDIQATNRQFSAQYVENMHRKKTGALIAASVGLAAIASDCTDADYDALQVFAQHIGLAFQIQDDILDIESATEISGKRQGADKTAAKLTYPQATSLLQAKQRVAQLHQQALSILSLLMRPASLLADLACYLIQRQH